MSEHQRVPIGVRFKEAGKVYYFDSGEYILDVGNYVVVETSHGFEIGRVVISADQVIASEIKETLKPIVRVATSDDLERRQALKERAEDQLRRAKLEALNRGLDMQVVSGEYNLDGSQITFYFTAPERVDFRNLVRDLSNEFDTHVQMLQVGDRDRAKLLDGYDVCGQRLCCAFLEFSERTATQFPDASPDASRHSHSLALTPRARDTCAPTPRELPAIRSVSTLPPLRVGRVHLPARGFREGRAHDVRAPGDHHTW